MKTDLRPGQWAEKYPELGTAPLPTEPYVSQEFFELERDRVFARAWLNVGRVDEIPEAGDYFVRDIAICGASVLVIRGADARGARLSQCLFASQQPPGPRRAGLLPGHYPLPLS